MNQNSPNESDHNHDHSRQHAPAQLPDPRGPAWDRHEPLPVEHRTKHYPSERGTVIYDPDIPTAWIEAEATIPGTDWQ